MRTPAEIIVVVDGNPSLLDRVRRAMPDVTTVGNRKFPGAGGARNAGLEKVRTEFVAFLDDDAEALPNWLDEHLAAYTDHPTAIGVGGELEPAWEVGRPRWFPPEFDWVVGCTYRGMPVHDGTIRNAISANMSTRTDVLRTVGGFRSNFGKVGAISLPEDTDLGIRVLEAFPEKQWVYQPSARARHKVPIDRSTFGYFCRRCFNEGIGKARLTAYVGPVGLASEREYTYRVLPRSVARGLARAITRRDLGGLCEAGAVIVGFVIVVAGYLRGRFG
jgi:GT2 family glycosyltransferase